LFFKVRSISLILLCSVFFCACGYRFAGSGEFPEGVKKIFIEVFENRTSKIGIERVVTNQIVFEFTRQRESGLAGSPDDADAVLKGVVTGISTRTISRIGTEVANEREVFLTVNLKLIKRGGEIVWAADGLSDQEAFDVTENKLETDRNESLAVARLSERMSERIFSRLTENF
jgi:outer membrane lipopolysaccharide assembly protein LptE/RlpB